MPVFNCPHPHEDAFAEFAGDANAYNQALAKNLQYDHRVWEKRANEFFRRLESTDNGGRVDANAIRQGLDDYFWNHVQKSPRPDFLDDGLNGHNFLPTDDGPLRINRAARLTRVLILSRLSEVYQSATDPDNIFHTRSNDSATTNKQLRTMLGDGWPYGTTPPPSIERFVRDLCQLLIQYPTPHNPAWATYWLRLKPYVEQYPASPERWVERLGVEGYSGDWVALLRYPIRDAGTVARPTQLDAGPNGLHFPSPPDKPVALGGCIMQLADSTELWPEFIHLQFDWQPEHFVAVVKMQDTIACDVAAQRRAHRTSLENEFPAGAFPFCARGFGSFLGV